MSLLETLLLAAALATDALAVSLAAGVSLREINSGHAFRLGWHFGFFQAAMTLVGWSVGLAVYELIATVDHWVAFGLLILVAARMIFGTLRADARKADARKDEETEAAPVDPTRGWSLVLLSVATSIDALAAGLSLSLLRVSIWLPVLLIGLTAALFSVGGVYLGACVGKRTSLGKRAELVGGVVLVMIGFWVLYRHGVLG